MLLLDTILHRVYILLVWVLLSQLYSVTQPLMVTYGDSSYASNQAADT